MALAAVQCIGGMFLIWGAATERFTLSYPMLLIAGFIFCNSNAAIDVVSVSCNVANWPQDRGSAGVMQAPLPPLQFMKLLHQASEYRRILLLCSTLLRSTPC